MAEVISASRARDVFAYDCVTGIVTRKVGGQVGPVLGRDNGNGYARVTLNGQRIYLHRLVWVLHYGKWPEGQVDHIDGNRSNNAISNLRDVDHTANAQNIHVAKSSSGTGILGVGWDKSRNLYIARISVGPRGKAKHKHLGRHKTADEAQAAYLRAKAKYHPAAYIAS